MLDKTIYINHLNQRINFGSDGIFATGSDARDYEWKYDSDYDEITNFRKGVVTRKITIYIFKPTEEEAIETANNMHAIFERDIYAEQHGKLIINGYYSKGYIIASKKPTWNDAKLYMTFNVTFASDQADWISENVLSFRKVESTGVGGLLEGLKLYPYKYPYRYANQNASGSIVNNAVMPSDFMLRIYGAISNPLVMIGSNVYQVNVSLDENEYLEINSRDKTIIITKKDGQKVNAFWSASTQGYIFEKIPTGSSVIAWDGAFAFDVVLFDTRSEPLW